MGKGGRFPCRDLFQIVRIEIELPKFMAILMFEFARSSGEAELS